MYLQPSFSHLKKLFAFAGESSLLADKLNPSSAAEILRVEARDREDKVQDDITISKVRRVQQSRRAVKQLQTEGKTVEVDAKIVTMEQKLSLETDSAAGTAENLDICSNGILRVGCDLWNFSIFLTSLLWGVHLV